MALPYETSMKFNQLRSMSSEAFTAKGDYLITRVKLHWYLIIFFAKDFIPAACSDTFLDMFYVYIIKDSNGKKYTGYTKDLQRRLIFHNRSGTLHTSKSKEWSLVFYCAFRSKLTAMQFEKYLKSGSGISFMNRHFL